MNLEKQISFLARTAKVLPTLVDELTDEEFRWKPESGNWSILEIVGHLVAEEQLDFRPRVKSTLEDPTRIWPSYDPEGIVREQNFNQADPQTAVQNFLFERSESLTWLQSLTNPQWNNTYQHPSIGPLKAGDVFLSWVVHDQLHIKQIAKRCFEMLCQDAPEFSSQYAGGWGP